MGRLKLGEAILSLTIIAATFLLAALMYVIVDNIANQPIYESDPQKREELFFKCLENLPAGPNQTMYNDWDEVVGECSNISYALSKSCVENCD